MSGKEANLQAFRLFRNRRSHLLCSERVRPSESRSAEEWPADPSDPWTCVLGDWLSVRPHCTLMCQLRCENERADGACENRTSNSIESAVNTVTPYIAISNA